MFKKIFVTFLCCLLLWNLLSNATGGLTPYTLPETVSNDSESTGDNLINENQNPILKPHMSFHWCETEDYQNQKEIISNKASEIALEVQQTKEQIQNNNIR